MRVGGDYGYCGGVQVAEQVRQVNDLILFLNQERGYKANLGALSHPIKRIKHVLGADQSQTHFCAKRDGIVIKTFNKGTKWKDAPNGRAAAKFCIPHDIVLKEGDLKTKRCSSLHTLEEKLSDTEDMATLSAINEEDDDVPIAALLAQQRVDSDSEDDDMPIAALLSSARNDGTAPPMGKAAEGEEVAYDFGEHYGTHIGAITEYDGDFYQVTFDDGDFADWDAAEYKHA
jgi:hypothetical protein